MKYRLFSLWTVPWGCLVAEVALRFDFSWVLSHGVWGLQLKIHIQSHFQKLSAPFPLKDVILNSVNEKIPQGLRLSTPSVENNLSMFNTLPLRKGKCSFWQVWDWNRKWHHYIWLTEALKAMYPFFPHVLFYRWKDTLDLSLELSVNKPSATNSGASCKRLNLE